MTQIHIKVNSLRACSHIFNHLFTRSLLLLLANNKLISKGCQLTSFFEIYSRLLTAIVVHRCCDEGWIHIDQLALDVGLGYFRVRNVGLLGDPILTFFRLTCNATASIICLLTSFGGRLGLHLAWQDAHMLLR